MRIYREMNNQVLTENFNEMSLRLRKLESQVKALLKQREEDIEKYRKQH